MTHTNTPTGKCCEMCESILPIRRGGSHDCDNRSCPCHTPTTDSKNSSEKLEQQLMDLLHEFNRENLEEPFDGQPLMRRARKWNYARQIIEIFQHIEQTAYTRGRKDAVEYIRKNIVSIDLQSIEENTLEVTAAELDQLLEAAITNPKD